MSTYKNRLGADFTDCSMVVDKSLDLYRYAGLLACAFPNAKFVHIKRNETDVAWSCYKHFFNKGLPWCYDLPEMKHFFEDFFGQIDHWRSILSESFVDVEYESLVTQPNKTLNQVFNGIGLSLKGDVSNGSVNGNTVATNSLFHVRKPISTEFVNKSQSLAEEFSIFNAQKL